MCLIYDLRQCRNDLWALGFALYECLRLQVDQPLLLDSCLLKGTSGN